MLNTPFAPWPSFTQEEADAVSRTLLSNRVNYWTGQECREFEQEFAAWCGSRFAVALSNGTSALEVALKALGIGPGDEVVVTPRTFIASASAIVMMGAKPVFADVDPDSQNITAATIRPVLSPRTRAIICVHLAGWPCEMDAIMALAQAHDLKVVEDCAQAHGARYRGRSVGTLGHIAAWSFCQDKIMTTGGEGGMVTTDDPVLWEKVWSFKDHGKSWHSVYEKQHPPGFRWLHEDFGTNFRMTELQAVLGRIQLKRMPLWHALRNLYARKLWQAAATVPALRVPVLPDHIQHAAYKAYVFVRPECLAAGWDRDRIMAALNAAGVPCYSGSCSEIYREQAFIRHGLAPEQRLEQARELGETSLMFLVHPTLTLDQVDYACDRLIEIMAGAGARQGVPDHSRVSMNALSPGETAVESAAGA
ncbi:MAG TPA: DegT/DnrJ/EryC1/StrS aminotransferase family protein [Thiolinea sp.]|nr:DegT/DnrJ/EryC1/StrS aminotransferase family protein [Thiolinea sp.]